MVLFINCCPREESRTRNLAESVLTALGEYMEINLYQLSLQPLNQESLAHRTMLIDQGKFDHPMFTEARQFAAADTIVIAAPFWDMSFPAQLKIYLENIYVTGIVSRYGENGLPVGMCRCQKLFFVTTSGGPFDGRFGWEYLKCLAENHFGIKETVLVKAEMLDVFGSDPDKILKNAKEKLCEIM